MKPLDAKAAAAKEKELKGNDFDNCEVTKKENGKLIGNSEKVIAILRGFVEVQGMLNRNTLDSAIKKLS